MVKRLLKWVLGIFVLFALFVFVSWQQTKRSLDRYCSETTAGTSLANAKEKALHEGFRYINYSSAEHEAFVTASGVMGRYVCVIKHDGKRVLKARMSFND
jgi:hypothetical protein